MAKVIIRILDGIQDFLTIEQSYNICLARKPEPEIFIKLLGKGFS